MPRFARRYQTAACSPSSERARCGGLLIIILIALVLPDRHVVAAAALLTAISGLTRLREVRQISGASQVRRIRLAR